ncbi:MAG: zinc ribbon domain-containing protein [Planctomycetaceae bacterium]
MDLKFCPSCGQSVLDDEAVACPFCGAAMDGSDKGKRKAPQGKPQKPPAKPSSEKRVADPAKGAKPAPVGIKPIKATTDEEDPFGLGGGGPASNAIQALPKPAKGCLHRVICPMCEKPGFVPKSAIGKQVRCANEKCMVPVFTAPDPNAKPAPKAPARRTPVEPVAAAGGTSKSGSNSMVMYGIAGAVTIGLGIGVAAYLNQPPAIPEDLTKGIEYVPGSFGPDPADIEAKEKKAREKAAAEAAANDPRAKAESYAMQMIQSARHAANRDKAYARRLTADVFLRTGNEKAAEKEFSQMLTVDRQAGYYQIEPRVLDYWRRKREGNADAAKASLTKATALIGDIPRNGRMALESSMSIASVLLAEGRADEVNAIIEKVRRDDSIIINRDAMAGAAWFFTSASLRSVDRPSLAASDVFAWKSPLRTAITADLANHAQFNAAMTWSKQGGDIQEKADAFAIVAELSELTPEQEQVLSAAAAEVHPLVGARVKAIIASHRKSQESLTECDAILIQTPLNGERQTVPSIAETLQLTVRGSLEGDLAVAALTEFVQAAIACENNELAEKGLRRLVETAFRIAPPTAETRRAVQEVEKRDSEVKRRIRSEMRIASDTQVNTTFRNYRRKIDQLAVLAEERRLDLMVSLARIVRGGGVPVIQAVFDDASSGLKQEVMVDHLAGMLGAAATRTGTSFAASEESNGSLAVPLPQRTDALHEIIVGPRLVTAWQMARSNRLPEAVNALQRDVVELPGLREAVLNEIFFFAATNAESPEAVYKAVGAINNAVWREEVLQTIGRIFARRGLDNAAIAWLQAESRMPPTESVCGIYGLAVGLTDMQYRKESE